MHLTVCEISSQKVLPVVYRQIY